ncbi:MAG: hydrolase 2, exosortase A system-associated [Pseudomonadota bacterium]
MLAAAQAFFLDTSNGRRFCVFHAASENIKCRGAVLFVAPFAEEMNKSRRMFALQARSLTQQGFAVLILDLYGCGDSDGELKDASWMQWKDDLDVAFSWLRQRCDVPISLLGLRLGAMLALDFIRDGIHQAHQIILWQPVLNGQQFLTQFFRLKLANDILSGGNEQSRGTLSIRQQLKDGVVVEIAGYEISSKLSTSIDELNASDFVPLQVLVHWVEIQQDANAALPPAKKKIIDYWQQHQVDVRLEQVSGPDFWMTQEISVCNELVARTTRLFTRGRQ